MESTISLQIQHSVTRLSTRNNKLGIQMKVLNAENLALNGQSFNDELSGLVGAALEPVKGVLSNTVVNNAEE